MKALVVAILMLLASAAAAQTSHKTARKRGPKPTVGQILLKMDDHWGRADKNGDMSVLKRAFAPDGVNASMRGDKVTVDYVPGYSRAGR
jgi:hypothetical protein